MRKSGKANKLNKTLVELILRTQGTTYEDWLEAQQQEFLDKNSNQLSTILSSVTIPQGGEN